MGSRDLDPVGANPPQTRNPYAAPIADATDDHVVVGGTGDALAEFYVVSKLKLYLLASFTFGFYTLYWFYAQFRQQRRMGGSVSPVLSAIFSVFTAHGLFKRVDRAARRAGLPHPPLATNQTVPYIALCIMPQLLRFLGKDDSTRSAISLGLYLLATVPLANVQGIINRIADDPQGNQNSRFSALNVVSIAVGALVWVLVIIGLFVLKSR